MLPAQISSPRRLTSPKAAALHASHGIAHGAAQRGLSPAVEADILKKYNWRRIINMYLNVYMYVCMYFVVFFLTDLDSMFMAAAG